MMTGSFKERFFRADFKTDDIRDWLIIFTRYPEPGITKTRLIPVLGPEGAADLQRQMTQHTVAWARELRKNFSISIEIHYEGTEERFMKDWLGNDLTFSRQSDGDIGARMAESFRRSFQGGARSIVLVGTDCPGLSADLGKKAFQGLQQYDAVLGPTLDGGYCLIGLSREMPQLFSGIPWGTGEVLERTLSVADHHRMRVLLFDPLRDIDRPEDL